MVKDWIPEIKSEIARENQNNTMLDHCKIQTKGEN